MPNQRAPGQKLLNFPARESFIALIKQGVRKCRECNNNRSEFIRLAIVEKLQRLGVVVPASESAAPSREGKGGPKPAEDTEEKIAAIEAMRRSRDQKASLPKHSKHPHEPK